MNILPKKRWHVRTKDNIARVRRDEAEAAEKERQEQIRIENADREARLRILKEKSKQKLQDCGVLDPEKTDIGENEHSHINLFENIDHAVTATNKEHDKEVKDKKEEYEKKIGYLTYLGQDTNEALGKKNWYEVLPDTSRSTQSKDIKDTYEKLVLKDVDGKPKTKELDVKDGEIGWKSKQLHDPLNIFKKKSTNQKKSHDSPHSNPQVNKESNHKKHSKKSNKYVEDKEKKLQKLREARLKREKQEQYKTELLLKGLHKTNTEDKDHEHVKTVKPKYNSQFNPELARQNYR